MSPVSANTPVDSGDLVGQLLGPYRVGRVIATGGSSTVYVADDQVALKVFHSPVEDRAETIAVARAELDMLRRAAGPGVPEVVDHDVDAQVPYIAMSLVHGVNLTELLTTDGPLDADELRSFATDLLATLTRLHRLGIVHGDVTPTNVVIDQSGRSTLVDFGLAHLIGTDRQRYGITPGWCAPEVNAREVPSAAADLFGWGLVVAFAASGRHPWPAAIDEPERLAELVSSSPPELSVLAEPLASEVSSALSADPHSRRIAYVPSAYPVPPTQHGLTAVRVGRDSRRRRRRLVVASVALSAMVVMGAIVAWSQLARGNDESSRTTASSSRSAEVFDETFHDGFSYNQFNGVVDVVDLRHPHTGSVAISIVPRENFYLTVPDSFRVSKYRFLVMWIHGGDEGARSLTIAADTAVDHNVGRPQQIDDIDSGAWRRVVVNVGLLVGDPAAFDQMKDRQLQIGSSDTKDSGTIYIDDVSFGFSV